ncbi:S-adenosyl-L-methionine-dependent methyltransferase [Xylariaceae sp. FL1019]|nr:S-adenosyl-L-methionine-dependent methyltransferase [Xylariaceae sp. FL1019]
MDVMQQLVKDIVSHSDALSKTLEEDGSSASLSTLMMHTEGPGYPRESADHRMKLIDALDELRTMVLGPTSYIFYTAMLAPSWSATFSMLYRYKIAFHVPQNESISYSDLATLCGLSEQETTRILRAAISLRVFEEQPTGLVKHNANSLALTSPLAHDAVGFATEEYAPAALRYADSLARFPKSDKASESPCAIANGSVGDRDIFSLIANDSSRVSRVANAMGWVLTVPETSLHLFLDQVPWSRPNGGRPCPKVVVDVGGSHGGLAEALLRRFPGIEHVVVEDLPEVTKMNREKGPPTDIAGRITYHDYDFFTEQDVKDADIYIFRTVIHDWPDSYAIKILQNQLRALRPGATILINDTCIDATNWKASIITQAQSANDIMVKMALNARERTKEDWETLVQAVDPGLTIRSITSIASSVLAVIEVVRSQA